jgi:predicted Zn-dependent protease
MLSECKTRWGLYAKWCITWRSWPVPAWVRAAGLYRSGSYEEAARHYLEGLQKHPQHRAQLCARMDLAYCMFKLGKFEQAEDMLRAVLAESPFNREASIRLAQVQLWTGFALEAAWTMRRALRSLPPDPELVGLFLTAVIESEAPSFLFDEAIAASKSIRDLGSDSPKLEIARARLMLRRGDRETGRARLVALVSQPKTCLEAILAFAEVLLEENAVEQCRRHLQRALRAAPNHPRVLSMLAQTYLKSGENYNALFALQLATSSCQSTKWTNPRDMHILAEAYQHLGDKMAALLMASKARQAGSRLLGTYRDTHVLDRLIDSLSSGSMA